MASSSDSHEAHHHEEFSLPLFAFTVLTTLAGLFTILRFGFPSVFAAQFVPPFWKVLIAFFAISLVNAYVEFFFHRYVLHLPAIPFLRRLYKQHTLHHALTRIARKPSQDGRGILFIENKFPIIEPEQGEASFFPWFSLAVFAAVLTPLLATLHWLLPSFPWFLSGFLALASSITLYEILHAINHWPFETWEPLITHRRWGWFWRPVYAFHLRHHAVIDCNESVSGFFGLPVADWTFGTCLMPKTIYADGEEWSSEKFTSPRPRWIIGQLDAWANRVVQQRREIAADRESPAAGSADPSGPAARVYTRGEKIANWATHGLGLALGLTALTLLIVFASRRGDAWHVVSFTVFGLALLTLYTVSTLFHVWRSQRSQHVVRKLGYAAVFLLIAGTYTPFLIANLRGPWGWTLFGIIWGLCGAGAVFRMIYGQRLRFASVLASLFIGWLLIMAVQPLLAPMPHGGLGLLIAGWLCYSVGVIFYRWQRLRYHLAVWYTFVLGGSTCHILAVLLLLLPRTP